MNEAIAWLIVPLLAALGSSAICYLLMQSRMEVAVLKERESLATERAALQEQRSALQTQRVAIEERWRECEQEARRFAAAAMMREMQGVPLQRGHGPASPALAELPAASVVDVIPVESALPRLSIFQAPEERMLQAPAAAKFAVTKALTPPPMVMTAKAGGGQI